MVGDTRSDELEQEFIARVARIEAYARTWWLRRVEPQNSFLTSHAGLRLALTRKLSENRPVSTRDLYERDDGNWFEERVALQQELLDSVANSSTPTDPQADVYFLIGLPGSGKTVSLRPIALAHAGLHEMTTIDADALRVMFPEYEGGLGSGVVQVENAMLTYGAPHLDMDGVQPRLIRAGGPTIVDVIGHPDHLATAIRGLAAEGRRSFVLLADCPVATCEERVKRRTVENGRYVPVELVRAKAGVPRSALDIAVADGLLAGWAMIDTSVLPGVLREGSGSFSDVCAS